MSVKFSGTIEFPGGFLDISLLFQCLSQLVMGGAVLISHLDRCAKLCNRALDVSRGKQTLPGVGGECSSLKTIVFRCNLGCRGGLLGRASRVAKLAKDSGQRGVGTGKIGLQADRFAK